MNKTQEIEIIDAYTDSEFAWPDLETWTQLLRLVTRRPEFVVGLPDGEFSVYRGGTPDGYSWTLSEKRAVFFATRFKPIGILDDIYTMTVTRDNVLWYTNDRLEDEVLIFPLDASKVTIHISNEAERQTTNKHLGGDLSPSPAEISS